MMHPQLSMQKGDVLRHHYASQAQAQTHGSADSQPNDSFSYEHRRKLQNRLAQRRYRDKVRRRLGAEDNHDGLSSQDEGRQDSAVNRNATAMCSVEEIDTAPALNPSIQMGDCLASDCRNNWDLTDCFDDLSGLTGSTQCHQNPETGRQQDPFDQGNGVLSPAQDNAHLQGYEISAKQPQPSNGRGDGITDAETPLQRPLQRKIESSLLSRPDENRVHQPRSVVTDWAMEWDDLGHYDAACDTVRRLSDPSSLGRESSRRQYRPGWACASGPRSQFSDSRDNWNLSTERNGTWAPSSAGEVNTMSICREKFTARANTLLSELFQLYKFGVDFDMIGWDEGFLQDLSVIRERFNELSDLRNADMDSQYNDSSSPSQGNDGSYGDASSLDKRVVAESHHQIYKTGPWSPDLDLTRRNTYQRNNLFRDGENMPKDLGASRLPDCGGSPRWKPRMLADSSGRGLASASRFRARDSLAEQYGPTRLRRKM